MGVDYSPARRLAARGLRVGSLQIPCVMVDSDSTRTESCAAIRSDPGAQMQVDGLKAADRNGSQQIIHPSQGELSGLKIQS